MPSREENYKRAGKIIGDAMKHRHDEKPLAMLDYFTTHFDELRHRGVSPQDFMNGCKSAWDEAKE